MEFPVLCSCQQSASAADDQRSNEPYGLLAGNIAITCCFASATSNEHVKQTIDPFHHNVRYREENGMRTHMRTGLVSSGSGCLKHA